MTTLVRKKIQGNFQLIFCFVLKAEKIKSDLLDFSGVKKDFSRIWHMSYDIWHILKKV